MRELPLKSLRVFESVARRGSFKHAADELCVSQSAVSHQIKHLEQWLDRPLFDRDGHRPQLLPHARVLSAALQRSFQDIDAACHEAQRNPNAKTLVIASIPSVANCWLIPRLPDFQNRYPDIATQLVYAFHGQDIDFRQVDMAFIFADSPPVITGYQTHFFQPGASVPVCSPALFEAMDNTTLAKSITKAGLLHDTNRFGWTDWLTQLEPHTDHTPTNAGPVFEDFNLLRTAALAGQGVALCPLALISTDLSSNRLIQLSSVSIRNDFNYYLIRHNSLNTGTTHASECFSEWVFELLHREQQSRS